MKTGLRTRLLTLLAALPLLLTTAVYAGIFEDLSMMGPKFPKKEKESREDLILVKFRDSVPPSTRDAKHLQEGNAKLRELPRSGTHVVQIAPSFTVDEAVARYRSDTTLVEFAEPNYVLKAMLAPNEPAFNLLWGLNNAGQTLGTPGADIRALGAWDRATGSPDLVVMVIDTGIDYTHPDLAANMWVNPGEIPGNGMDDDGNGYIDDIHGIDVVNGDSDPMDDHGHGTHVAGTIGAVGNNSLGVVGVNWNVKLIACKFLDATGSGQVDQAVECLEYARALKARGVNIVVTNNSYGGLGAVSDTLRQAIDAQRDILFFAAAGNFGLDNDAADFYPADFDLPNVLSIAATDHNDLLPSFSDYGRRSVHLGAPGVNIYSTVPFSNYASANGTSMASPHAAGVATLLRAQDPARDWRALKNLTLAGGDVKPSLTGKTITGRRLNAANATACSNRPVFSAVKVPATYTVNVPATISALSINCGSPVGPVTGTSSAGASFTLRDDGVAPDQAAGDGEFTATWTPTQAFSYIDLTSPAGTERLSVLDLAVNAASGPTSANRGDQITISATVANPSTVAAPASTMNFYLSVDGVITTSDILLGTVATPALAAGTEEVVSAPVVVPISMPTGTYFVGAIVDPADQLDEVSEANNARSGNGIVINSLAVDLTVSSVSGPTSAFTGDPISVSATVANIGTASAGASSLNFYLSLDGIITSSDTLIGTAAVGALAGGASQTVSGTLPVPAGLPPGTYYIGAIADAGDVVLETNEGNNSRSGNQITTSTLPIDLTVTAVSGPSTANDGAQISLTATVKNVGSQTAPGSTLTWYLSADPVITPTDIPLASVATGSLRGNRQQKLSSKGAVPAEVPAGTYYIGAMVDPGNTLAETDDANNTLIGGTVSVSYGIDLAMTAVAGPGTAATGENVTFTGTVANQGFADSGSVVVGFYVSSDPVITKNDALIATTTLASLAAGASAPVSASAVLRTDLTAGTYYVGAIVDPDGLIAEANEDNNAAAGSTIDIRYGPDLVMTAVGGPATTNRGKPIKVTGTVANIGSGAVGALGDQGVPSNGSQLRIGWYISNNPTVTANDTLIATYTIGSLPAGQSQSVTVNTSLPNNITPGTWYIGAIADFSNALRESNELNNALPGNSISVR